jgi:prepilin-type N-terminal cleavage/methylation domain-containing protein
MTRNKKAYTLIEVLIVGIIIAILAAIGFSNYETVVERSKAKAIEQLLHSYFAAYRSYALEHGGLYPTGAGNPATIPWDKLGLTIPSHSNDDIKGYGSSVTNNIDPNDSYFDVSIVRRGSTQFATKYILKLGYRNGVTTLSCTNGEVANICRRLGY